jgi:hypothetical protein
MYKYYIIPYPRVLARVGRNHSWRKEHEKEIALSVDELGDASVAGVDRVLVG